MTYLYYIAMVKWWSLVDMHVWVIIPQIPSQQRACSPWMKLLSMIQSKEHGTTKDWLDPSSLIHAHTTLLLQVSQLVINAHMTFVDIIVSFRWSYYYLWRPGWRPTTFPHLSFFTRRYKCNDSYIGYNTVDMVNTGCITISAISQVICSCIHRQWLKDGLWLW